MAEDHTPPAAPPAAETDPLRDMWLFILFAIGLVCFLFFAAPKGCSEALQEKSGAKQTRDSHAKTDENEKIRAPLATGGAATGSTTKREHDSHP